MKGGARWVSKSCLSGGFSEGPGVWFCWYAGAVRSNPEVFASQGPPSEASTMPSACLSGCQAGKGRGRGMAGGDCASPCQNYASRTLTCLSSRRAQSIQQFSEEKASLNSLKCCCSRLFLRLLEWQNHSSGYRAKSGARPRAVWLVTSASGLTIARVTCGQPASC